MATSEVERHRQLLRPISSAIPIPSLQYTVLHLKPDTMVLRCDNCGSTEHRELYSFYQLPCGHVLERGCLKETLHPTSTWNRCCPKCQDNFGLPLPWLTKAMIDSASDHSSVEFAMKVDGGLDLLCKARANAVERLNGTHRPFLHLELDGAVLSLDTCIWSLLAMGSLLPQRFNFDEAVMAQWDIIIFATYQLLHNEFDGVQGSVLELRVRLRYAIFAFVCGKSVAALNDEFEPLLYKRKVLQKQIAWRHGADADILWKLINSGDVTQDGYLTLLIDSLIDATWICGVDTPVNLMRLGGVDQGDCGICLSTHECVTLPCGHCFGRECLLPWWKHEQIDARKRGCPMCRTQFPDYIRRSQFKLEYSDLSAMFSNDLRQSEAALLEAQSVGDLDLQQIQSRKHALWRILESNDKYTISSDNCLFPLVAMSKCLKKSCAILPLVAKEWQFAIAVTCSLFRSRLYGRQGTASQLHEEVLQQTSRKLRKLLNGKHGLPVLTMEQVDMAESLIQTLQPDAILLGDALTSPLEESWYQTLQPDATFSGDELKGLLDFLILYAISKCPKHELRGRFDEVIE